MWSSITPCWRLSFQVLWRQVSDVVARWRTGLWMWRIGLVILCRTFSLLPKTGKNGRPCQLPHLLFPPVIGTSQEKWTDNWIEIKSVISWWLLPYLICFVKNVQWALPRNWGHLWSVCVNQGQSSVFTVSSQMCYKITSLFYLFCAHYCCFLSKNKKEHWSRVYLQFTPFQYMTLSIPTLTLILTLSLPNLPKITIP